jgi:serine protease Do
VTRRTLSHPWLMLVALMAMLFALTQSAVIAQDVEPIEDATALLASEMNTIDVVETYGPSVVAVQTRVAGEQVDPFGGSFGQPDGFRQEGSGSGFLIRPDDDPYLVTNYHVVELALEPESVEFRDGGEVTVTFPADPDEELPVRVVGINPSFDLALLSLADTDAIPAGALPLPLADSSELRVGQKTIAIGNPFGLASSVSSGIVSGLSRFVPTIGELNVPMIQTDAAINPGNSGGPLLDSRGQLIGINTALINPSGRSFAGLGFAIPSDLLAESLANLELGGVIDVAEIRPRLGITAQAASFVPLEVQEEFGLPGEGVAIVDVLPGSVAAAAGLRPSERTVTVQGQEVPVPRDIITAVDGEPVETVADLSRIVTFESEPGETLEFTVSRDGESTTVPVTVTVGVPDVTAE